MLLHSTISQSTLQRPHVSLSSTISHSLSYPSGLPWSTFLRTVRKGHDKNPIVRYSLSQAGRVRRGWSGLYKRISLMQNPKMGAGSVLNKHVKEGNRFSRWELWRVIQELRKSQHYKLALEVYEWMNDRPKRFGISTSDAAIQLGLIAKVRGILYAEDYFLKLSDTLKDKKTYGALLLAYVHAKSRKKAESLFEEMKAGGYATESLSFNFMMSLYMNLKEYDKVDSVALEMRQENISLDTCSYNSWLASCGAQGSVEKVEQLFEQMMETNVKADWNTFSTMAAMYIELGLLEKAENCIKKVESRIKGRGRSPYHFAITLYSSIGKKEEVYRVWKAYNSVFPYIPNMGYYSMISSVLRLGDIEGAEQLYEQWQSVKSTYEPRIVNVLMSWYVRNGLFGKAEALFDQIFEIRGKPNASTWEILAFRHIRENNVSDALSCLKEAYLVDGSKTWKPRPANVSSILEICEQNGDTESKGVLMELLKQGGCLENEDYMSHLPIAYDEQLPMAKGRTDEQLPMEKGQTDDEVDEDENGDGPGMLLDMLLRNF